MPQTKIKYCRNCQWAEYGWCTVFQQDVKPVAGKCPAFITKSRKTKVREKITADVESASSPMRQS